jgi:methyl-accepting chemotaxis protein
VKVSLLDIDIGLSGYFVDTEEKMRRVVRDQLGGALAALAKGDLTVEATGLPPEYASIQQDFNAAVQSLRHTLGKVVDGVDVISTGSSEIRAACEDLSARTEQQAASLERTAASISDVTAKVQATAQTTANARSAMSVAHDEAEQSSVIVQRAVEAMSGIEASSREISQIIAVIDGIAFQTNLLALNAGVEAARAGDAGKGFAVVANEVRALAQRSADAANDIKKLITSSAQQVSIGVDLVSETGSALGNIAQRITGVRDAIEDIAVSAEQQAGSLLQINNAVADVDRMTQQNASMSEECTAAASNLASSAGELHHSIQDFTFDHTKKAMAGARLGQSRRAA